MANTTTPIRLDDGLVEAAKVVGPRQSRSATQQITHWARIGQELEASRSMSTVAITDVLAGRSSYDGLEPEDQALVRAAWVDRIAERREGLDLADRFAAQGRRSWIDIDADGNPVERSPRAEQWGTRSSTSWPDPTAPGSPRSTSWCSSRRRTCRS